jgi:uncharacterized membrane protein YczE
MPGSRLARRLIQLGVGLVVMGVGVTALKRSQLGLSPWDALHDGIGRHTGVDLGIISILVGIPILVLWVPLRQRPGPGTVANVLLVGWVAHALLPHWSPARSGPAQVGLLALGLALFALGQGLYLSADLGPGPRDGLMTGLSRRFGWSIRVARTAVEATALLIAVGLGGSLGLGTVIFAATMGPMVQVTMRWFGFAERASAERALAERALAERASANS